MKTPERYATSTNKNMKPAKRAYAFCEGSTAEVVMSAASIPRRATWNPLHDGPIYLLPQARIWSIPRHHRALDHDCGGRGGAGSLNQRVNVIRCVSRAEPARRSR